MTEASVWARRVERGTVLAFRFVRFLYRALGRRARRLVLWPIAWYFFVTSKAERRASREWLAAVWTTPAGRAALRETPGWRTTLLL